MLRELCRIILWGSYEVLGGSVMILLARCRQKVKFKPIGCVVIPKQSGYHVVYPFSIGVNHYSYTDEYIELPQYLDTVSDLYELRSKLINSGYTIDWEVFQKLLNPNMWV